MRRVIKWWGKKFVRVRNLRGILHLSSHIFLHVDWYFYEKFHVTSASYCEINHFRRIASWFGLWIWHQMDEIQDSPCKFTCEREKGSCRTVKPQLLTSTLFMFCVHDTTNHIILNENIIEGNIIIKIS